ncbi:hypothetical protein ACFLZP_01635 [Patescibacteria group bacterium]
MTIKRARDILKTTVSGKSDREIQSIIDRLRPFVELAVQEAKYQFGLDRKFSLKWT